MSKKRSWLPEEEAAKGLVAKGRGIIWTFEIPVDRHVTTLQH